MAERHALVQVTTEAGDVAGYGFLAGHRQVLTCAHVVEAAAGVSAEGEKPPPSVRVRLVFL